MISLCFTRQAPQRPREGRFGIGENAGVLIAAFAALLGWVAASLVANRMCSTLLEALLCMRLAAQQSLPSLWGPLPPLSPGTGRR